MDVESLPAQYLPLLKKYWLPLALFLFGLIFFAYGLMSFLGSSSKTQDITFKSDSTTVSSKSQNLIQVDVEGAVMKPGVYKLASDSIIQDALVVSQGLSAQADRDWVSKSVNLAAKLYDGAKVYIPKIGEASNSNDQIPASNAAGADTGVQISALININTASADSLDSLPGVGPATASKIIGSRPYSKIDELLNKKVVSSKVFDQIKDKITVY
jgi:competence protein ComEA